MRALVVDGHPQQRQALVECLKIFGFKTIIEAADGEEGYAKFQKNHPDIVFTEWALDKVDGVEMIRWMRRNVISSNRMIPVIMISGYSAARRVVTARDSGINEFLSKPYTAQELSQKILHVINKPRDFVESEGFVGPDRRRRSDNEYDGYDRRKREKWF